MCSLLCFLLHKISNKILTIQIVGIQNKVVSSEINSHPISVKTEDKYSLLLLGSQQNFGDGKVRTKTVAFKLITALLANQ